MEEGKLMLSVEDELIATGKQTRYSISNRLLIFLTDYSLHWSYVHLRSLDKNAFWVLSL